MSEHVKCLLLCMKNMIGLLCTRLIMTHPVSWFFIRPKVFLKIHAHVLQNSPCKKKSLPMIRILRRYPFFKQPLSSWALRSKPWLFLRYLRDQLYWYYPVYIEIILKLGGGFQYFLFSNEPWGNDPIGRTYFFKMGWFNHQLESHDEDPYEATCSRGWGRFSWISTTFFHLDRAMGFTGRFSGIGCLALRLENIAIWKTGETTRNEATKNKKKQHNNLLHPKEGVVVELCFCSDDIVLYK